MKVSEKTAEIFESTYLKKEATIRLGFKREKIQNCAQKTIIFKSDNATEHNWHKFIALLAQQKPETAPSTEFLFIY